MKKRVALMSIAALLLMSCGGEAKTKEYALGEQVKVQILHTSDLHGRFISYDYADNMPTEGRSLAAVSTAVNRLRKEIPLTFLIDTGDTFQDNANEVFVSTPAQNPMLLAMNKMGYDSMTVGNHEFNFGMPYLMELVKNSKFAVLGANVYDAAGKRLFKPYTILEKGGVKVAVLGIVTPSITIWDRENLAGYTVTMPNDEMEQMWPEVEGQADLIILANHLAMNDESLGNDGFRQLIERYPGADAALAAHAHSVFIEEVGPVVAVEPGWAGRYLSQIIFTLEKTENGFVVVDRQTALLDMAKEVDDPAIVKLTERAHQLILHGDGKNIKGVAEVIGQLSGGPLVPANEIKGIPQAQLEPTALIALINEVQMFYAKADVASVALFREDANLAPGPILRSDVAKIYKYDNTLRSYRMTGAQLKRYMEWSVAYFNTFTPGDLTISFNPAIRIFNYDMFSGVQYDINIANPVGQRIQNLRHPDGRAVQETDSFVVALNDYRAQTTLMTELFPNGEVELIQDFAITHGSEGRIRLLIDRYIREEKGGQITNDFDRTLNNYQLVGYSWNEALRAQIIEQVNAGAIVLPSDGGGRQLNSRALRASDLLPVGTD